MDDTLGSYAKLSNPGDLCITVIPATPFVIPTTPSVIPTTPSVIPATPFVIPVKTGIQGWGCLGINTLLP